MWTFKPKTKKEIIKFDNIVVGHVDNSGNKVNYSPEEIISANSIPADSYLAKSLRDRAKV